MPYKKTEGEELPLRIKRQIIEICGDYRRREIEISRGKRRKEVLEKYDELNKAIDSAVSEICKWDSDEIKSEIVKALGEKRGYNWSPLCTYMSGAAFYRRKSLVMKKIAEKLDML